MWATLFGLLFLATALAFLVTHRRQEARIAALRRSRDKIEGEETRVFAFLHGLGTALTPTSGPGDLNVLIVEGALRVLEAHGGGLYRADKTGARLVPQFVSRHCPAFFAVAAEERGQVGFDWVAHLRRRSVAAGEGVLGEVWRTQEPLLLQAGDPRLGVTQGTGDAPRSVMISPLVHGEMKLGVLAVARAAGSEPFLASDFRIFKAVAEQSAFALHNAIIFSEAAEKKRLERELQDAHEIQRILLPANEPDITGYQISGINLPAQHVSGDYYDYVHIDDAHVGVVIADVSGKGIAASLVMATCRSVLQSAAAGVTSPAATLRTVNARLFPDIKEDMFISMAYAIIDQHSPAITLCRAGHDAPLLYCARDRTVSRINPPGMAVGIDSGGAFNRVTADFSLTLERDDCLILYTDGVTEALDSQGEEFGMANVIKSILASASEGAAQMIAKLTGDLRQFVDGHPQHDDITLIVIRKT
jgi:sigma-B regulation protein RsbU (phosphoserine phosphatase)